jgi:hypothetical protein
VAVQAADSSILRGARVFKLRGNVCPSTQIGWPDRDDRGRARLPVLEKRIGQHIAGVTRSDGGIDGGSAESAGGVIAIEPDRHRPVKAGALAPPLRGFRP